MKPQALKPNEDSNKVTWFFTRCFGCSYWLRPSFLSHLFPLCNAFYNESYPSKRRQWKWQVPEESRVTSDSNLQVPVRYPYSLFYSKATAVSKRQPRMNPSVCTGKPIWLTVSAWGNMSPIIFWAGFLKMQGKDRAYLSLTPVHGLL